MDNRTGTALTHLESSLAVFQQKLQEQILTVFEEARSASSDYKGHLQKRQWLLASNRRFLQMRMSLPRACFSSRRMVTELGYRVEDLSISTQLRIWRLHPNHGSSIRLSKDRQSASREGWLETGGIVVSDKPLECGWIYEVEGTRAMVTCGIISQDPATITLPPDARISSLASALPGIVIDYDNVWNYGVQVYSDVGAKLWASRDLIEDRRVGLSVDSSARLHLYIDGQHQGVAATDIQMPCYPWFDAARRFGEVTTCPLRKAE